MKDWSYRFRVYSTVWIPSFPTAFFSEGL